MNVALLETCKASQPTCLTLYCRLDMKQTGRMMCVVARHFFILGVLCCFGCSLDSFEPSHIPRANQTASGTTDIEPNPRAVCKDAAPIRLTHTLPLPSLHHFRMWNALESGVDLHKRLASALGDAQYFDDSISPVEIRRELQCNTANPGSSDPTKAMKWLLASISKGRDVSEFYPDVIKLVASPNLQVRKMVYTYMQHAQSSELSLLSINSLQRGLSDAEPLIRAMALRALTSVPLVDICQIQLLAIAQHVRHDPSPYVRKYAAMAMAKVRRRIDSDVDDNNNKGGLLLELVQEVLERDPATMVLSSAVVAFWELTDGGQTEYLHLLHGSFRKLCTLLTDMDEWGQVICIHVLLRYARHFFKEPRPGSAEQIDASRRVMRDTDGNVVDTPALEVVHEETPSNNTPNVGSNNGTFAESSTNALPPHTRRRRIIKRRVVKKGFYSDEEDESTEEEVYSDVLEAPQRLPEILNKPASTPNPMAESDVDEEENSLAEDHKRLLHAAMPLLKSRNAGVVLAVCCLQYYCGVSSVRVRKALGKALVRIHRHTETQFVVLSSIRRLVRQCPSAFSPFLQDFFVLQMDAPQTKLVKLDILTSLALDPPSIQTVLQELRAYVQVHPQDWDDVEFVCASIQAVGRVAELARICYRRQNRAPEAIPIVLNCLYGLVTLSHVSKDYRLVGDTVIAMQRILQSFDGKELAKEIDDPNRVRQKASNRIVALLVHTLSKVASTDGEASESNFSDTEEVDSDDTNSNKDEIAAAELVLPPEATATALNFVVSAVVANKIDIVSEQVLSVIGNLLLVGFLQLEPVEKEQAMLLAGTLLADGTSGGIDGQSCYERILALGRIDTNSHVRDRARYVSCLLHSSKGLAVGTESLETTKPTTISNAATRGILYTSIPAPSYLPIEKEDDFRFGSLSSMVNHKVQGSYLPLPMWADENSPDSLRDEPEPKPSGSTSNFYGQQSDGDSSSSSSSSNSSSSSDESSSDDSDSDSTSSSSSTTDSSDAKHRRASAGFDIRNNETSDSSSSDESSIEKPHNAPLPSPTGKLIQFDHQPVSSSLRDDFAGLVVETPATTGPTSPNLKGVGKWLQVLRPEHANGLSLDVRYLRGKTREDKILALGWSLKPSIVCLQVLFKNAAGKPPQRRIRIVQRSSSSTGSTIGPSRISFPEEVGILNGGDACSERFMAIEFSSLSDRDGCYVAKLEIKAGSSGKPIEIKPSLGDMLQPTRRTTSEFDATISRMQGFNRVQSTFTYNQKTKLLPQITAAVSLSVTSEQVWDGDKLRLVGSLPSSGDDVFVLVECATTTSGTVAVCCDHALVINPIMNVVKEAIMGEIYTTKR